MTLILASGSATRRKMLEDAGIPFEVRVPDYDEEAAKAQVPPGSGVHLAMVLARGKALAVDAPGRLVLGADQVLETADHRLLSKPATLEDARRQLLDLRGKVHSLDSVAVLARDGKVVWIAQDTVKMHVRDFSDAFLDAYLAAEGEAILSSVGAYRVEGLGVQLFDRIEGSHFTVLGLPLLGLLQGLRLEGALTS